MSGHSKWSKIKHKKGAVDAKRGAIFTKLGNAITIAAREGGGDPEINFGLRLAIDKAKANNVPKENIERAIKRGIEKLDGTNLKKIVYEGFLPNKIPIIIEVLTDNKNRTISEIKQILEKNGGTVAGPGSVMWMFEKKGMIEIKKLNKNNLDETELKLIDAGADDIEFNDENILVYTKTEDLKKVKDNLENAGFSLELTKLELIPKNRGKNNISNEEKEKLQILFELLEENDDVINYYTDLK